MTSANREVRQTSWKALLLARSFYFIYNELKYLHLANVDWITIQSREISSLEISSEY